MTTLNAFLILSLPLLGYILGRIIERKYSIELYGELAQNADECCNIINRLEKRVSDLERENAALRQSLAHALRKTAVPQ
jgi:hypothetical protein